MSSSESNGEATVSDWLEELTSRRREDAWSRFLEEFSPLILHLSRQYASDPDSLGDCYQFICEKLGEQDCRRLRRFDPEGVATFRSWLNVVIANLCIDWRRQAMGRMRPFSAITQLPLLEQKVFQLRFQQNLALAACLETLHTDFPDLNEIELAAAVARVNRELTPYQRRLLLSRQVRTLDLDDPAAHAPALSDESAGPEQSADLAQRLERLEQALSRLPPRQRLLLRLRFQQDITLKEIAMLLGLGDPFRARREIDTALAELKKHLAS